MQKTNLIEINIRYRNQIKATRFFLYKNTLYKNVHDENGQKMKNIVRILPS